MSVIATEEEEALIRPSKEYLNEKGLEYDM